ncbi:MAG: hypothetical protein U0930_26215 [Pirellulales bacterium]
MNPADSDFDAPKSQNQKDADSNSNDDKNPERKPTPRTAKPKGDSVTGRHQKPSHKNESAQPMATLTSASLTQATLGSSQTESTSSDDGQSTSSDESKNSRTEADGTESETAAPAATTEPSTTVKESTKQPPKGRKRLPPALADLDENMSDEEPTGNDISSQASNDDSPKIGRTRQSAPINFSIDERGNLIIQSSDTTALDRIEQWMTDNKPPRKNYDLFKVRYARASWVCLNLKEYFSKEREGDRRRSSWEWDWGMSSRDRSREDQQLGKRPELQFIYDNDTNSIVVRNADDLQRQTIEELIQLWDVPDPKDKDEANMRFTKLIPIRHTRAELVLTTVKEAYRDMLSANDKTFDKNSEEKRESSGAFTYRGKLSLGADEVSNSILVSAEGKQLFTIVCDMIKELDEAAKEAGVIQVMTIGNGLNTTTVEGALKAIMSASKAKQEKAPQPQEQQQPEQKQPGQNAPSNNPRSNRSSR